MRPIQVAHVDVDQFLAARREFTTEEWMDVLLQSMGFNPEMFSRRGKLLLLVRLIPYCERNYNLIELGPKGTGKSHLYADFSPHGMVISGSEVTAAKLFVNVDYLAEVLRHLRNQDFSHAYTDRETGKEIKVLTLEEKQYPTLARHNGGAAPLVHELTPDGEETKVSLLTKSDPDRCVEQDESLRKIQESCAGSRLVVEYDYDKTDALHARSITTDTGWKITLDRGLDIYQRYEISPFMLAAGVQEERLTKAFEVTYLRPAGTSNA